MIRLIACDLDGTLLNSRKELPDELPDMVRRLEKENISFVPVSGRSYARLKEFFGAFYSGKMRVISGNGVYVFDGEERISPADYTTEELSYILSTLRGVPGLHIALIGAHTAWYEDGETWISDKMKEFFGNIALVDRVEDMVGMEPVGKVSSIDDLGVQTNSFIKAAGLSEKFYIADAGDNWFDVMPKGVDKGTAIRALASHLGIGMDEVMIFGDFLNDLPMMGITENSWCMKNGHDSVKRISGHVTKWTNDENGVIKTIREVVFGEPQE